MNDEQFRALCNVYGFAPSRALRELLDTAIGQTATELRRLYAQRDALLMALRWIATVNAMDYEYQKVARAAIKAAEENT